MEERGGFGRAVAVGVVLGVLAILVAAGAIWFGEVQGGSFGAPESPSEIVVVGVTRDTDGAALGGIIFLLGDDGSVTQIDPSTPVTIPGTGYGTLADAYTFGGGEAVATAVGASDAERPEWIVLADTSWTEILDEAGGAAVVVRESANVLIDDRLYVIETGPQVLSGAELLALWASADYAEGSSAESIRATVADSVAQALVRESQLIIGAAEEAGSSSSMPPAMLEEFAGLR